MICLDDLVCDLKPPIQSSHQIVGLQKAKQFSLSWIKLYTHIYKYIYEFLFELEKKLS